MSETRKEKNHESLEASIGLVQEEDGGGREVREVQ